MWTDGRARVGRQAQAQAAGADGRRAQTGCGRGRRERGGTARGLRRAAKTQSIAARLWLVLFDYYTLYSYYSTVD